MVRNVGDILDSLAHSAGYKETRGPQDFVEDVNNHLSDEYRAEGYGSISGDGDMYEEFPAYIAFQHVDQEITEDISTVEDFPLYHHVHGEHEPDVPYVFAKAEEMSLKHPENIRGSSELKIDSLLDRRNSDLQELGVTNWRVNTLYGSETGPDPKIDREWWTVATVELDDPETLANIAESNIAREYLS